MSSYIGTRQKPPLSYQGGKQRMASKLLQLLPSHTVYVESFAGGAALLFAKGRPAITNADHYREAINDLDDRLATFYRVASAQPEALLQRLRATPYARSEYMRAKAVTSGKRDATDLDIAAAVYVELNCGFGAGWNSGWARSTSGQNHALTWQSRLEQLESQVQRLGLVHIECKDAIEVIETWDSPQTLHYCDPPYPGADQRYAYKYSVEDYQNLVDRLDQCAGSFLLSGYDHPDITIPDGWEWHRFDAVTSLCGTGKTGRSGHDRASASEMPTEANRRGEVVWRVDRSSSAREDLRAIMERNATLNSL